MGLRSIPPALTPSFSQSLGARRKEASISACSLLLPLPPRRYHLLAPAIFGGLYADVAKYPVRSQEGDRTYQPDDAKAERVAVPDDFPKACASQEDQGHVQNAVATSNNLRSERRRAVVLGGWREVPQKAVVCHVPRPCCFVEVDLALVHLSFCSSRQPCWALTNSASFLLARYLAWPGNVRRPCPSGGGC